MNSRLQFHLTFLLLVLYTLVNSVKCDAGASSTSHVTFSMGRSIVSYNNDHESRDARTGRGSTVKDRKSTTRKQPTDKKNQPSVTKNRSSDTKNRSSDTKNRSFATKNRSSASENRSSASKNRSSVSKNRSSGSKNRSSAKNNRSSATIAQTNKKRKVRRQPLKSRGHITYHPSALSDHHATGPVYHAELPTVIHSAAQLASFANDESWEPFFHTTLSPFYYDSSPNFFSFPRFEAVQRKRVIKKKENKKQRKNDRVQTTDADMIANDSTQSDFSDEEDNPNNVESFEEIMKEKATISKDSVSDEEESKEEFADKENEAENDNQSDEDDNLDIENDDSENSAEDDNGIMTIEKGKMIRKKYESDKIYHPSLTNEANVNDEEEGIENENGKDMPLIIPRRRRPIRPKDSTNLDHASGDMLKSFHPLISSVEPKRIYSQNIQNVAPKCSEGRNRSFCDSDLEYPTYEVTRAAHVHVHKLLNMYADIPGLSTESAVDLPKKANGDESYICPADITYAQIFRAKNSQGKWRIIVNNIEINYQILSQTARLEECVTEGESCTLLPHCYASKCAQRFEYHRFLVYDPYDTYFPFAMESFMLPSSCACHLGGYEITH